MTSELEVKSAKTACASVAVGLTAREHGRSVKDRSGSTQSTLGLPPVFSPGPAGRIYCRLAEGVSKLGHESLSRTRGAQARETEAKL